MRGLWAVLCLLAATSVVPLRDARAADYPTRPVRIVVQVAAGSSIDISARIIADHLTRTWNQQVIVLNRPGANGALAVNAVRSAEPDGYTLLMGASSIFVILPELQHDMDVNKLSPIGFISEQPMVFATAPNAPFKSIADLITYSKNHEGGITVGVITHGGMSHLTAERFRARSGASMRFIYYPGTQQALSDVMAGRIDMMVETLSGMLGAINGKSVNALAVASASRLANFPNMPTIAETVSGFVASGWTALVATPGTPSSITQKISVDLQKIVTSPDVTRQFAKFGSFTRTMNPLELSGYIRHEQEQWKPIIEQIGIRQN
jgi:tripartite-type tricarboxylate transporter receptor subunit TctC